MELEAGEFDVQAYKGRRPYSVNSITIPQRSPIIFFLDCSLNLFLFLRGPHQLTTGQPKK